MSILVTKKIKKNNKNNAGDFPNFSNQGLNLNGFDYGQAKQNQGLKKERQGHIQVYLPKNFDESFDIIKSILVLFIATMIGIILISK